MESGKNFSVRVRRLTEQMTLAEKSGELCNLVANDIRCYTPCGNRAELGDYLKKIYENGIGYGAFQCLTRGDFWTERSPEKGFSFEVCRDAAAQFLDFAARHHRLGIKPLLFDDCRHGVPSPGCTIFPVGIARGATWNRELNKKLGNAVGEEMAALGVTVSVGPNMNLARDPRWGRMEECFSEDPYLAGSLGRACVQGIQQTRKDGTLRSAGCIHFLSSMGDVCGGLDAAPVAAGPVLLRTLFRPFAMAAEARAAMASYSSVDGIPCHADREVLQELLRKEAGFRGVVESDAGGIYGLYAGYKLYEEPEQCYAAALKAGINLDLCCSCTPFSYAPEYLERALEKGYLCMKDIDERVCEVLQLKEDLGLLDHTGIPEEDFNRQEHRDTALDAARQTIILLSNREKCLPWQNTGKEDSVALIGPHIFDPYHVLGDYTPYCEAESLYDSFLRCVPENCRVLAEKGCNICSAIPGGIRRAVELAGTCDRIVLTLGGSSNRYGQRFNEVGGAAENGEFSGDADCGEGIDRCSLELFPAQMELLKALKELGKPLVVLLIHGRPFEIGGILDKADAVLDLWYPGEGGGEAAVEALWGKLNPGGKLPVSMPLGKGFPFYSSVLKPGRKRYFNMPEKIALPLGYGLSYTEFTYSSLQVTPTVAAPGEKVTVSVEVCNSGSCRGDEVVQLYLTDEYSSYVRPLRELCGFERITLEPGESRKILFEIEPEQFAVTGRNGSFMEEGDFLFTVGCEPVELPECRFSLHK